MKLHLGCGNKLLDGYVNVDISGNPDVKHDLNVTPWPFEDNSVDEIKAIHVLEHLGQTPEQFINILKEIYRVCKPDAFIEIIVPHYNHDDFKSAPTHVRCITMATFSLFDKSFNNHCKCEKYSNSTLGLDYDINFKQIYAKYNLDPYWRERFFSGKITKDELDMAIRTYNNVVNSIEIHLKVVK